MYLYILFHALPEKATLETFNLLNLLNYIIIKKMQLDTHQCWFNSVELSSCWKQSIENKKQDGLNFQWIEFPRRLK